MSENITTEAPAETPVDVVSAGIAEFGTPIELGGDANKLREISSEVTSRRVAETLEAPYPEPHDWSGADLPTPGEHESAHAQARKAAVAMGNERRASVKGELESVGFEPEIAAQTIENFEAAPTPRMLAVRDDGTVIAPLHDKEPVREKDILSRTEMQRAVSNFRSAQELEQQRLIEQFSEMQEAKRLEAEQTQAAPAPTPASSAPQPQPSPTPASQPTP